MGGGGKGGGVDVLSYVSKGGISTGEWEIGRGVYDVWVFFQGLDAPSLML